MPLVRFTKLHGLGNDYLYIDGFRDEVPPEEDLPELARAMSHRNFGVGADGIILVLPPTRPDAVLRMRMFNADGSEAEMCGNGVRGLVRYAFEHGLTDLRRIPVETGAGIVVPELIFENGQLQAVKVDMGRPRFRRQDIPMAGPPGEEVVGVPLDVGDTRLTVTCLSMGNPHCVIFLDRLEDVDITRVGPAVERHPFFPQRTNVEFIQVVTPGELRMKVWERGSGVTLACGTGAAAALAAAVRNGLAGRTVVIHLDGGDLVVSWEEGESVFITGPAEEVFRGEYNFSR